VEAEKSKGKPSRNWEHPVTGNTGMHNLEETLTGPSKRLRSEGSTSAEEIRPPERPKNSSGPGIYKEALTNIQIGFFKEYYPEDKMTEDD
jgi:hypothetical protein